MDGLAEQRANREPPFALAQSISSLLYPFCASRTTCIDLVMNDQRDESASDSVLSEVLSDAAEAMTHDTHNAEFFDFIRTFPNRTPRPTVRFRGQYRAACATIPAPPICPPQQPHPKSKSKPEPKSPNTLCGTPTH